MIQARTWISSLMCHLCCFVLFNNLRWEIVLLRIYYFFSAIRKGRVSYCYHLRAGKRLHFNLVLWNLLATATKLGRNVHWIGLYQEYVFVFKTEINYRNKGPQGVKRVAFCCWVWILFFSSNLDESFFPFCSLFNSYYVVCQHIS